MKTSIDIVYEKLHNAFVSVCKAEENIVNEAIFGEKQVWHKEYNKVVDAQQKLSEILDILEKYKND